MENYKVFGTLASECVMMSAGSLLQVSIDEVTTNFNSYGETTSVRIKGKNCDKVVEADADVCYKDLDDFREGKVLKLCAWESVENDYAVYKDGKVHYYVFENGEPILMEKSPKSVTYIKDKWSFDFGYEGTPYKSRQTCLDHNSFFVVDKEGKKEEVVGIAKLVSLTDEQRDVLDQLVNTLKKAHEIKLRLAYEYAYDQLYAFNGENLQDDWCAGWEDKGYENIYDYAETRNLSIDCWCEFEHNFIGVNRK